MKPLLRQKLAREGQWRWSTAWRRRAASDRKASKAPVAHASLSRREPRQWVSTYSTGQRRKSPAERHDESTAAMPPCVSSAVPTITTVRVTLSRAMSRLRRRAEVAADIEVPPQHPPPSPRPALDAPHLPDPYVATAPR